MVWGLLIAGDFNFHLDDLNNKHAKRFVDILDGFGLQQHVKGPTHNKGHTLDLIITTIDLWWGLMTIWCDV